MYLALDINGVIEMQNNRNTIKKINIITIGIWFLSMLIFILGTIKIPYVSGFIFFYGIWNLGIFSIAYQNIAKNVNTIMQNVDDCIQSMIDGQPIQKFSIKEESLLGKFQMQLLKLYQILNNAKKQEEKMRKEMGNLITDLVHQINTPLTNIQMYTEFLIQDELSKEEKKHMYEILNTQIKKLGWFAEGFTKTARLEEDIRKLNPKKQPILPMILSAIDEISLKAQDHGNEISLEGKQDIQAFYDRRWTEEAIFNLLDNAVKYGREGTTIFVKMSAYDLFVRIDIMNYGDIIPKEEYPKLFYRFYRGKNAALIKEGVGLGLYLARQIITEQGGYIKIQKESGKGNLFTIFLLKQTY